MGQRLCTMLSVKDSLLHACAASPVRNQLELLHLRLLTSSSAGICLRVCFGLSPYTGHSRPSLVLQRRVKTCSL